MIIKTHGMTDMCHWVKFNTLIRLHRERCMHVVAKIERSLSDWFHG